MNPKVHLTLPVPNETPEVWATFKPFVERFLSTLNKFDPGSDYDLHLVRSGDPWIDSDLKLDEQRVLPFIERYDGNGWDIGAAQYMASQLSPSDLVVSFTTRSYFHRDGWLKALLDARNTFGPGLYGTSASNQIRHHVCVRSYLLEVADFQDYPWTIDSRALGPCFETGVDYYNSGRPWVKSITEHMASLCRPLKIVRFDGVFDTRESIGMKNGFRNGDQSEMLVWDKHSDIYAQANPYHKQELERLTA